MRHVPLLGLLFCFVAGGAYSQPEATLALQETCKNALSALQAGVPGDISQICKMAQVQDGCQSVQERPIFHFDYSSTNAKQRKILVFALTHGDEHESGVAAAVWMHRLNLINPRNSWRIVPLLNPDGYQLKTRTNARGVDLNRNFPTHDWDQKAKAHWEKSSKNDPRRNPGDAGGSEPETRCAVKHIETFQPDFIVSIHTPYGILDFDGPRSKSWPPSKLPWVSLGNFPGSLGRYMWQDRKRPVLTIELTGLAAVDRFDEYERLQDISGDLAIRFVENPEVLKDAPQPQMR